MKAERLAAALLVVASVLLHAAFFRSAGPLWRDEINSVRLANAPSLSWFAEHLQFDSSPVLMFALLRIWPFDIRLLGLLIGLGILAAVWWAGRAPLIALALAGTSGAVIRYGDSIRSYGLAMLLSVLFLGFMERRRWLLAGVFAVLAVQSSWYAPVVILALCLGAATAGERREAWKPIAVGAVAALSLLPYVPTIRSVSRWSGLARYDVDALWLWHKFSEAAGERLWLAMILTALVATAAVWKIDRRRALFAGVSLAVLTIAYFAFLYRLAYLLQPWYFVLYLCIAALLIDALLSAFPRAARIVAAVLIAAISFLPAKRVVEKRATSMDRVAAAAAAEAAPRDLVIVYPWYVGVSFSAYYHGAAPWTTLPSMADHTLHRYDLAKAAAEDRRTGADVAHRAAATLHAGGRVWLAGLPLFEESAAYLRKPDAATGIAAADLRWSGGLAATLQPYPRRLAVPPDPNVSEYENVALLVVSPR